jgi:hypothetical protein
VEGRVEAGHVRHVGQELPGTVQPGQRLGLVQRGEVDQIAQLPFHARIDDDGLDQVRAAVHDAVPDRVDVRSRVR